MVLNLFLFSDFCSQISCENYAFEIGTEDGCECVCREGYTGSLCETGIVLTLLDTHETQ